MKNHKKLQRALKTLEKARSEYRIVKKAIRSAAKDIESICADMGHDKASPFVQELYGIGEPMFELGVSMKEFGIGHWIDTLKRLNNGIALDAREWQGVISDPRVNLKVLEAFFGGNIASAITPDSGPAGPQEGAAEASPMPEVAQAPEAAISEGLDGDSPVPDDGLCHDEGCEHHGTPHVCMKLEADVAREVVAKAAKELFHRNIPLEFPDDPKEPGEKLVELRDDEICDIFDNEEPDEAVEITDDEFFNMPKVTD